MRAFELSDYGGPGSLALVERPVPEPGPGDLLVEVEAIGLNFYDELMTWGRYQHRPPTPVVPGSELAGTVVTAPAGSPYRPGDRVAGYVHDGAFAELVALPVATAVPVPVDLPALTAAAAMCNYHTALFALTERAAVEAGESVLVLGASGALGSAAVQVAHVLGCRVLAGVRRDADLPAADVVVDVGEGLADLVRAATDGRGVDVVLDPVGGRLTGEALEALAPLGRLVVLGFASGDIPELPLDSFPVRNVSVVGAVLGAHVVAHPALLVEQAAYLNPLLVAERLRPHVARTAPFEQLPVALADVGAGRAHGKFVVSCVQTKRSVG